MRYFAIAGRPSIGSPPLGDNDVMYDAIRGVWLLVRQDHRGSKSPAPDVWGDVGDQLEAALPLLFTATQSSDLAHETETVAVAPPGNTRTGVDQRPCFHSMALPLRPITVHAEVDPHETEYAKPDWNPGMADGGDQLCPSKIT